MSIIISGKTAALKKAMILICKDWALNLLTRITSEFTNSDGLWAVAYVQLDGQHPHVFSKTASMLSTEYESQFNSF